MQFLADAADACSSHDSMIAKRMFSALALKYSK